MQAFLLAAGLGTRLRPLTLDRPKALVEVNGRTLLEINLLRLISAGARRVVVNVHHFAPMVKQFLASKHWDAEVLVSDESALLLDTGGGLRQASSLFLPEEPIVVHNVDVLHRLDIASLVAQHADSMALATLLTSQRTTSRYLLGDAHARLVGWTNQSTGQTLWSTAPCTEYNLHAFSGIAILRPDFPSLLPPAVAPYPIIPQYLELSKHHTINLLNHPATDWLDVGKPSTLPLAERLL